MMSDRIQLGDGSVNGREQPFHELDQRRTGKTIVPRRFHGRSIWAGSPSVVSGAGWFGVPFALLRSRFWETVR